MNVASAYRDGLTLWDAACALGVGRKITWPSRDGDDRQRGSRRPPPGPDASSSDILARRRAAAREGRKLTEDDVAPSGPPVPFLAAAFGQE